MIRMKVYNTNHKANEEERKAIIDFLYEHLEQFGDPWEDIEKAYKFALQETHSFGGFVLVSDEEGEITGVVLVNKTGMSGYIPENILVYIATHKDYRGKGIGKALMQKTIELADGDIALHVEPDNPARFLYEKVGFTSKYQEMRFKQPAN